MQYKLNNTITLDINNLPYAISYQFLENNNMIFMVIIELKNLHKAAMCVGGAVYGYFNDDMISEKTISIINSLTS